MQLCLLLHLHPSHHHLSTNVHHRRNHFLWFFYNMRHPDGPLLVNWNSVLILWKLTEIHKKLVQIHEHILNLQRLPLQQVRYTGLVTTSTMVVPQKKYQTLWIQNHFHLVTWNHTLKHLLQRHRNNSSPQEHWLLNNQPLFCKFIYTRQTNKQLPANNLTLPLRFQQN